MLGISDRKKSIVVNPGVRAVRIGAVKFLLNVLLLVVSTAVFTYISVYLLEGETGWSGGSFSYYYVQLSYLWLNFPWMVVVFCVFVLLVTFPLVIFSLETFRKSRYRIIILSIELGVNTMLSLGSVLIGLAFSLLGTFVVYQRDLGIIADEINDQDYEESIVTDVDKICMRLDRGDGLSGIVAGRENANMEIIKIKFADVDDRSEYYKEFIPAMIPSDSYPYLKTSNEAVFLYNDSLFITRVDVIKMEEISMSLARAIVAEYFNDRNIKSKGFPEFDIVGRDEYMEDRRESYEDFVEEYDLLINEVDDLIDERKEWINKDQQYYEQYGNDFWLKALEEDKEDLAELEGYKVELEMVKENLTGREENVSHEVGVFMPPDSIKMAHDDLVNNEVDEYLSTLIHEYLHFVSNGYWGDNFNAFFEEGLTEHYTRKIMVETLGHDRSWSYSIVVKILRQMMVDVPEDEFEEIYFSKDGESLVRILDGKYGDGFYEKNLLDFNYIVYSCDDETLDRANVIMDQIGGDEITWSTVYSE